jgi:ABC-2 type transport system permease protein
MPSNHSILKPFSFLLRDVLIMSSYKLNFILQLAGIFITTLLFFFLSKLFERGMGDYLQPYGGDYFAFVIIGIAITDYLTVSLNIFAGEIRTAQMMGTLEALLVTPTSVPTILFSSSLFSFTLTSVRILVYIVYGMAIFGLKLHLTNVPLLFLIVCLTIFSFTGIGLISAGFIIIFKQGSPLNLIMGTASGVLGGILYPISVLPAWLQPFSYLLPITHALEAIRQMVLNGKSFSGVYHEVVILGFFSLILLPAGVVFLLYGLRKARMDGSLLHY